MKKEIGVNKPIGYKAITVIKLLNGVGAYHSGKLSFKALRVYMACYELEAIREAAKRSSRLKTGKSNDWIRYERKELVKLTGGLTLRSIGKSLKELERASVMKFSKDKITFTETPIPESKGLLDDALSGRKGSRAIPVPRSMLKMLAGLSKPSLFLSLIAYMIRGLSIDRKTGGINPRGTVKASWIAKVFNISIRAVRSARAQMVEIGLIQRDSNSYQRKLNRDGSYFNLNLLWQESNCDSVLNNSLKEENEDKTVDNSFVSKTKLAPLRAKNRTQIAPPYIKLKTSKEYKNQKTQTFGQENALRANSGFYNINFSGTDFKKLVLPERTNKTKHTKKIRKPILRDIKPDDLKRLSKLKMLYAQAIKAKWLEPSEANFQNFVSAAVRATRTEGDSVRIFVSIVKKGLWINITQAQEDRAREIIQKVRNRKLETAMQNSPLLSKFDIFDSYQCKIAV